MRASALGSVVLVCFAAVAVAAGCGDDDPPPKKKTDGPVECEGMRCDPLDLPGNYPDVPACCAEGGVCGLDGTQFEQYGAVFVDLCQPRDQPGEADDECPASTPVPTDFGDLSFRGCCTPAGRCGYLLDNAFGLVDLGLGCVDAEPFLDGGVPTACTPGPGGGSGGAGGE